MNFPQRDNVIPAGCDRRQWLQICAAVGGLMLAAPSVTAQGTPLSLEMLARANQMIDSPMDEERLRAILPAVQRNWDFFKIVRDTPIDDAIEPAPVFHARGKED